MRRLRLTFFPLAVTLLLPLGSIAHATTQPPPPSGPAPQPGDGEPSQPSTPGIVVEHQDPQVAQPDAAAADQGAQVAVPADWVPPEAPAGDGPRFIDSDDPRYDERYDGVCVAAHFGAWCYGPAIDPPDEGVWDEPPSAEALRREAVRIIHTEPLPSLTPRIDPGWGIVGKQMFLETGATMAFGPEARQTAFGPLQLAAASVVYVDWGDGHVSGPLEGPGEPWPDGTITHAWRDAGHYWVVVWQYWAVNWRLDWEVLVRTWEEDEDGNEVEGSPELVSGTLTGQELLTGMNWLDGGFPVRELQAVRHH